MIQKVKAQTIEELIQINHIPKVTLNNSTSEIFSNTNDKYCSSSILLSSNNVFTEEAGCEGRSNVGFGRWRKLNDSIIFLQYDSTLPFISGITITKNRALDSCNCTRIRLIDVNNKPISYFTVELIQTHTRGNNNLSKLYRNPENTGTQIFETNEKGILNLSLCNYDTLRLIKMIPFLNPFSIFTTKSFKGKDVLIKLNIHNLGLHYSNINFSRKHKNQRIKVIRDKLTYLDEDDLLTLEKFKVK